MWHDSYRPITPDDNGKQKLHNDLLEIKAVRIIIITLLNAGLFMLDRTLLVFALAPFLRDTSRPSG